MSGVLFAILASVVTGSALAVVFTQNIVRAAVWLLLTLVGTAGLYLLLGAEFVGASQLIVYVGGTLVLVVFGIMLTGSGPFQRLRSAPLEWGLAGVTAVLLWMTLLQAVAYSEWRGLNLGTAASKPPTTAHLGAAFLGVTQATPAAEVTGTPAGSPKLPRTPMAYLLPFELVSVHLLVVLIGAAYLARAKRKAGLEAAP
jgi:NADH-quinone oxidoreductase subunit J